MYKLFVLISYIFFTGALKLKRQKEFYDATLHIDYTAQDFKSDCVDCGEPLFLTPLIKANKLEEARRAAYVNITDRVPDVDSYSGFLTVNEKHNANLFFWYFPVKNKPIKETPLILWLQGGPGDSSLFGLFKEIGPFTVTSDMKLKKKKFSWAEDHSLLFIDNPVGTGFSFADEDGYATNQTTIGENLYSALQQFMTLFPTLRHVPFVIAGESYAGKHVPSLAVQLHWNRHKDQPINLQAISIGNGFMDPMTLQSSSKFLAEAGILDDKTAEEVREVENECIAYIEEGDSFKAHDKFKVAKNIVVAASQLNVYNFIIDSDFEKNYVKFVNMPDIRRKLHVGCKEFHDKNERVYDILTKTDFMFSVKPWLNELLDNYQVLLYKYLFLVVALQLEHQEHFYKKILEYTYSSSDNLKSDCVDCEEPLFLTPLIKANKLDEARRAAYVNLTDRLADVDSYSGFLTVNEKNNGNLFFWYFPVMNKPVEETPLILWLQGGPGVTSMYGLFKEIGPFTVTDDMKLKKKEFSWAANHSLLFIDNPVGTGFSFTDDDCYATNQTTIGENLYSALQQFMTLFPTLRRVPFVIAGESYAGKHVPSLAIQLHWNRHKDQPINLQGISIGNGFIDPITLQTSSRFYAEAGLIDENTANKVRKYQNKCIEFIKQGHLSEAFRAMDNAMGVVFSATQLEMVYNFLSEADSDNNYQQFLELHDVRRALHVGSKQFNGFNGHVYGSLLDDFMNSAKPWLNELLDNYKVLVYSGHLDMMVPYHASVNTYNSLNFTGAAEYKTTKRKVWKHNNVVAGYYKKAGNFLEVMVRGAGHMVPIDKGENALNLISSFVRDMPLSF